jgi:hypothetical protein
MTLRYAPVKRAGIVDDIGPIIFAMRESKRKFSEICCVRVLEFVQERGYFCSPG